MSDTFGFEEAAAKKTTKDRLANIRPSSEPAREVSIQRIDAIADRAGFPSREALPMPTATRSLPRRKKKNDEPRVHFHMHIPETEAAAFIKFCDDNRYSYWEALTELMRRANVS